MPRIPCALIVLALMGLAIGPAMAQGTRPGSGTAEASCRSACTADAVGRPGGASPHAVQACGIRCAAGAAFHQQQSRRGTPEATGRGRAVAALAQPVATLAELHAATRQSFGVIYVGRPGSSAFGISTGGTDRGVAHRDASRQCNAGGAGCRVVSEFSEACGAVAQGIMPSRGAMFITSDPSSYVATSTSAGSAATRELAAQDAVAQCRTRDPRASCRVMATVCGARG